MHGRLGCEAARSPALRLIAAFKAKRIVACAPKHGATPRLNLHSDGSDDTTDERERRQGIEDRPRNLRSQVRLRNVSDGTTPDDGARGIDIPGDLISCASGQPYGYTGR
jgi:hypothetical protein